MAVYQIPAWHQALLHLLTGRPPIRTAPPGFRVPRPFSIYPGATPPPAPPPRSLVPPAPGYIGPPIHLLPPARIFPPGIPPPRIL